MTKALAALSSEVITKEVSPELSEARYGDGGMRFMYLLIARRNL